MKLKIGNAYKKRLSDLGDRSSNPQLWDEIYYELSSSLFYVAVHAYLDICRVSIKFLVTYNTYFLIKIIFRYSVHF